MPDLLSEALGTPAEQVVRKITGLEEQTRQLRIKDRNHVHGKTVLVSGGLSVGMVIPRFWTPLSNGGDGVQGGVLISIYALIETGGASANATIHLRRGNPATPAVTDDFGTYVVTNSPDVFGVPVQTDGSWYPVNDGDWWKLDVDAITGSPADLSFCVNYVGLPGNY